jgi:uncharacterized Zn finger protein
MVKKKSSATRSTPKSAKYEPPISEGSVKRMTSAEVFGRGEDYFENGAIVNPVRIGNILSARCHGSGPAPYRVRVTFDKRGVADATCNCPYDWGGYCKHIVALLLTHIRAPKKIKVKPPVEELLAGKKQAELNAIIAQMVEVYPDLYGLVDGSGLPEDDEYDEGDFYDNEW